MKQLSFSLIKERVPSALSFFGLFVAVVLICVGVVALASCSQPGSPSGNNSSGGNTGWSSKTITTYAGNGIPGYLDGPALSAELKSPYGIYVDKVGYLYIADYGNSRVRWVGLDGTIHTAAGTGSPGYNGDNISSTAAEVNQPSGVALDPSGYIVVADTWNDRIRDVALDITTLAGTGTPSYNGDGISPTSAELAFPNSVFYDSFGNLYIADSTNNRVRVVNKSTGLIGTVAGSGSTGPVVDGGQATATAVTYPYCAIVDSTGNIYISQPNNNVVRKVDTTGKISTYAGNGTGSYSGDNGPAVSAELHYPTSLAFDSAGNLYICDSDNCCIREVNSTTRVITTVVGTGLAGFSPDGTLATQAKLMVPMGIAFDSSGTTLYIADSGNNVIRVVK